MFLMCSWYLTLSSGPEVLYNCEERPITVTREPVKSSFPFTSKPVVSGAKILKNEDLVCWNLLDDPVVFKRKSRRKLMLWHSVRTMCGTELQRSLLWLWHLYQLGQRAKLGTLQVAQVYNHYISFFCRMVSIIPLSQGWERRHELRTYAQTGKSISHFDVLPNIKGSIFRCATKIAECAVACCAGNCVVSATCVACLGSFYEECKSCWSKEVLSWF